MSYQIKTELDVLEEIRTAILDVNWRSQWTNTMWDTKFRLMHLTEPQRNWLGTTAETKLNEIMTYRNLVDFLDQWEKVIGDWDFYFRSKKTTYCGKEVWILETPLSLAIYEGATRLFSFFESGAEMKRIFLFFDSTENCPSPPSKLLEKAFQYSPTTMHIACQVGSLKAVSFLSERNYYDLHQTTFDIEVGTKTDKETIHALWEEVTTIHPIPFLTTGITALHIAVTKGYNRLIPFLLTESKSFYHMKKSHILKLDGKNPEIPIDIFDICERDKNPNLKKKKSEANLTKILIQSTRKLLLSSSSINEDEEEILLEQDLKYFVSQGLEDSVPREYNVLYVLLFKINKISNQSLLPNYINIYEQLLSHELFNNSTRLLNQTHFGHADEYATCLQYIWNKELFRRIDLRHDSIKNAINEYWEIPPPKYRTILNVPSTVQDNLGLESTELEEDTPKQTRFSHLQTKLKAKIKLPKSRQEFRTSVMTWWSLARNQFYIGFFLYVIFLIAFTIVTLNSRGNSSQFYYFDQLQNQFLFQANFPYSSNVFPTSLSTGINSIEDIWIWLNNTLLDYLYPETKFIERYNILLGKPTVRQLRVKPRECGIFQTWINKPCYDIYSIISQSEENFGTLPPYIYQKTGTHTFQSALGINYPFEGGFIQELNGTLGDVQSDWIDDQTSVIIVDFSLYNPNLNSFLCFIVTIEIPSSGYFVPSYLIFPGRLVFYNSNFDKFVAFLETGLLILFCIFIGIEVYELKNERMKYFKNIWNYLEVPTYILFLICACVRIAVLAEISHLDFNNFDGIKQGTLPYISSLENVEANILAICSVLFWFRLIKFLRILDFFRNRSLPLGVLFKITFKMLVDLIIWFIILFVSLIGFSLTFTLLLQSQLYDYRSWASSFATIFLFAFGSSNWSEIEPLNNPLAAILFYVLLIYISVMLLNLVIAMLNQSYSEIIMKASNEWISDWIGIVFQYVTHQGYFPVDYWLESEEKSEEDEEENDESKFLLEK